MPIPSGLHRRRGDLEQVRFRGGRLSGALLELPAELVATASTRLVVTAGGRVFDRTLGRDVAEARVVELPHAMRS